MRPMHWVRFIHTSAPRWHQTAGLSSVTSPVNILRTVSGHVGRLPVPAGPVGGAICRRCSIQLSQQHRWFSSGSGEDPQADLKGFVFHVPNLWALIKNKFYLSAIRRKLDPTFSIEEFLSGAKQAMCLLTELTSRNNYEDMTGLLEPTAIDDIRRHLSPWTPEQQQVLAIQPDNIYIATPKIHQFFNHGTTYILLIDVLFVAFKTHQDQAYMFDLSLRFCRSYGSEIVSDWTISNVEHIQVRQFQPAKET